MAEVCALLSALLVDSVSHFVSKMCKKFKLSENGFSTWYDLVVEILDNRIKLLSRRGLFSPDLSKPLLSKLNVHKDVQDLHEKYVLAPADNVAYNFCGGL